MAIIKYGALATEIRGSIGGTTFQANKYGFSVKNKPNIVKPRSVKQTISKQIINWAVNAWGLIGPSGRADWNAFAVNYPQPSSKNPSAILSGYNAFLKWHLAFFLYSGVNAGYITSPEVPPATYPTAVPAILSDGSAAVFEATFSDGSGLYYGNLFMTPPLKGTRTYYENLFRLVGTFTSVDGDYDIAPGYTDAFGRLPLAGEIVAVELQLFPIEGGKVSNNQRFLLTVQSL
jgi:hypothetical protein